MPQTKMILSMDGGGIRGAASARFLQLVEAQLVAQGSSLRDCVDFYAGTSTGSIIALALATTDIPMSQISELYNHDTACDIFAENRGLFEFDGINAPRYEAGGKSSTLKDKLGDTITLGDVRDGKHVLAVSYDIQRRKPDVIKSTDPEHRKLMAYQVADSSSAAPTYFPTREMHVDGRDPEAWLVDGGVTANNPTMCAIAEAKRAWDLPIDRMRVLSVGTGYRTRKINGPASQHWGAMQWFTAGHILDVLTDERVVSYQAMTLMRQGSYIRVNADMCKQGGLPNPPDDAMDDISRSNIDKLRAMGDWWFAKYGQAAIDLLLDRYGGPSLDRIDASTGEPKR